jgi:hypothetical protein
MQGYDHSIQINNVPEVVLASPQDSSLEQDFFMMQHNFKTASQKSNGPVFLDPNAR